MPSHFCSTTQMKTEIEASIVFECNVPGLKALLLEEFVARARREVKIDGCVSVLITKNREMLQLNRRFRGKNLATDVLSFPAASAGFAGDIAISIDIAMRNAKALGHRVADEVRVLILHGVLHLAGYDHETDQGEMEEIERELRKKLGLPTGLIERTSSRDNSSRVGRRPASLNSHISKKSRVPRKNHRAGRVRA